MNINTPLVDTLGRDLYSLGGPTSWKTGTYKGYCVSLEWFSGRRTTEPMLAIWPVAGGREAGVWGICLSSVGKYADPSGKPTPEAFAEARATLVECFDRAPLQVEVNTLVDVVMHYIPDLILMPPMPRDARQAEAGKALLEVELSDENTGKTLSEDTI